MTRQLTIVVEPEMSPERYAGLFAAGKAPDRLPYGAENPPAGWSIDVVSGQDTSRQGTLLRKAVKKVLGFDVVNAWRVRDRLRSAPYVYSHSEREYLGAAAVLKLLRIRTPVLVAQTIWLFESWESLSWFRRRATLWALSRVDLFVANAEPNADLGRTLVPGAPHVYVPFGVSRLFLQDGPSPARRPLVLSVGDDISRDWPTLDRALQLIDGPVETRIATGGQPHFDADVDVRRTADVAELLALYREAAVAVVPVRPNAHASGITSLLEAVGASTPVVASRAGGLEAYFTGDEVTFVDPEDPAALAAAISAHLDEVRLGAEPVAGGSSLAAHGYVNTAYWERIVGVLPEARA